MQEIDFIDEYYNVIKNALIQNSNLKEVVTLQNKIDIYTKLYQFCTTNDEYTKDLYDRYEALLISFCHSFKVLNNKDILDSIISFIDNYDILVKYLYFAFNYLDKHYVKHNDLLNLKNELPDQILLNNIILNQEKDIVNTILNEINLLRNKKEENTFLFSDNLKINQFLKKIINIDRDGKIVNVIMNSLLDNNLLYYNNQCLKIYDNSEESSISIIKKIKKNYTTEFNLFNTISIPLETKKQIFNDHSVIFIKKKYKYLINNLNGGLKNLIELNDIINIPVLIEFVNLDEEIYDYISDMLSEYFLELNNHLIDKIKVNKNISDRINYIKLIVQSYNKFKNIIDKLSDNDNFKQDLYTSMEKLVNYDDNIVCIVTIMDHINNLLISRDNNINTDFLIDFVKFLENKEFFYNLYHQKLENRILNNLTDFNYELNFFNKILSEYPYRRSSKIKTIFKDLENSKKFTDELKNVVDQDMNIKLFTATYWKLNEKGYFKEINFFDDQFSNNLLLAHEYHGLKFHNLRKLYVNHLEGEIIINYNGLRIKTIPLIASVITVFNTSDSLNLKEIAEKTLVESEYLNKILNLLVNNNILLKDNDYYKINNNFKYDQDELILSLNNICGKKKSEQTVEDPFKLIRIEATIVKIMKKEDQQNLDSIISKTKEILKKFNPSIDNIKKSLENLIDREYLKKEEDNQIYSYILF